MSTNDNFGSVATTINTTIDALIEIINGLAVIGTYNVQVCDGFTVYEQQNVVIVGGGLGNDADGGQQYAGTGGPTGNPPRMEQFTLELIISAWVGGTEAQQKTARDTATAIFTAIASFVRANTNLPWSGAPTAGAVSRCQVNTLKLEQTTQELVSDGRIATYTVGLLCDSNYLTP